MKLFKKLIPVATVASVACVVAPLATSCAYKTYKYNLLDMEGYEYVEQKTGELSKSQATRIYLEELSDNKKILADDIAYSYSLGSTFKPTDAEESDLNVGIGKIDVDDSRISVKINWSCKAGDKKTKETIEFKNIPVQVKKETIVGSESQWSFSVGVAKWEDLKEDSKWKLSVKIDAELSTEDVKKTYDHKSSDAELELAFNTYMAPSGLVHHLNVASHYLAKAVPIN